MTPLSEADPEVRLAVTSALGGCRCGVAYTDRWTGHEHDERDPRCVYHRYGERVANLVRENRALRRRIDALQSLTGARIVSSGA